MSPDSCYQEKPQWSVPRDRCARPRQTSLCMKCPIETWTIVRLQMADRLAQFLPEHLLVPADCRKYIRCGCRWFPRARWKSSRVGRDTLVTAIADDRSFKAEIATDIQLVAIAVTTVWPVGSGNITGRSWRCSRRLLRRR